MRRITTIVLASFACHSPISVFAKAPVFTKGVVAADHELASRAGAQTLARGGNAVDAAIATSFCLSVVRPMSCGIGGGGFMMVYDPNAKPGERSTTLSYRETAPAAVGPEFFAKRNDPRASRFTGAAVGVPGNVAGLWRAHERFGVLEWRDLLAPAIRIAENGFAVNDDYMNSARDAIAWYKKDPSRITQFPFVWKRFLNEGTIKLGDVVRNPEQAKALRLIAANGPPAFYDGPIADAIIKAVTQHDGVMTSSDLESFTVREKAPLKGTFHGRRILAMPPPSSGGIATLQTLGILQQYETLHDTTLDTLGHNSAESIHIITEAFKNAFADRAQWLGDADFADVPVKRLLDPGALQTMASRLDPQHTRRSTEYGIASVETIAAPPDDSGTSHYSIIDRTGMAVAATETINLTFGSHIVVDGFGFCLNNQMDDFTTISGGVNAFGLRQSDRNLPAPGKRPLSSMSPTIVLNVAGQVELVTGGRGGPRIITGVIQSILNVIAYNMDANDAVSAPRFHHQWFPNVLALEPVFTQTPTVPANASPQDMMRLFNGVTKSRALKSALSGKGHLVGQIQTDASLETIHRTSGGYEAASDPRGGGAPAGVTDEGQVVLVKTAKD